MVIDDGVAKHAIEPSNRALLVVNLVAVLESLYESRVEDIFSRFPGSNPEQKEFQELVTIGDQYLHNIRSEVFHHKCHPIK